MQTAAERIESILASAVDIEATVERRLFIDRACGGDDELRRRVEELVENHFHAGSFLEQPAVGPAETASFVTPAADTSTHPGQPMVSAGDVIGPYKLLVVVGEGGMGTVYLAEQHQPVRRRVALKIIKPGMDTRQVVARFEAERQALALMDHPNIAKVFDGGATESGRPYFVMELVRGLSITSFCDDQRLAPRSRLELFIDLCSAVQHAHQKGIIHRDIKPSNIMVASHDGTPVVKIIDFGVAKAVGTSLTDRSIYTGFAQMVGTPLYMSPEQAGSSVLDVDTRTDIYALGVLLYELLTGTTPFDEQRLHNAGYDEIRRIIREEEPARPSTRISTLGPAAATISASRQTDPETLRRQYRGELDWIVMKCLEKDRNRRYETAAALIADIRRYLHDEPVLACPPTAGYRLRKFVRRNKGPVLAASVIALAVVVGAGVSTWQAIRATNAERLAADRLDNERNANAALVAAHGERDRQEKHVYRELGEAMVDAARLREIIGRGGRGQPEDWALLRTTAQRANNLAQNPLADESQVRQVRAILVELDQFAANRRMVSRLDGIYLNKGSFSADTLITVSGGSRREYEAAFKEFGLPIFELPVEVAARRIADSPISDWLVAALDDCASNNKELCERLMPIAQLVHPDAWRTQYFEARARNDRPALLRLARSPDALNQPPATLSMLAFWVRQSDERAATALLREAQRRHPLDLWINYRLSEFLTNARPEHGASDPYFEVRRARTEAVGFGRLALAARPDSPALLNHLAGLLHYAGQHDEAAAICRRSIELNRDNPAAHRMLAMSFGQSVDDKQADASIAAHREAVRIVPGNAQARAFLADALAKRGDWAGAIAEYRQAVVLDPRDDDGVTSDIHSRLGEMLEIMKDLDGAAAAFRRAIEIDPSHALTHFRLGQVLRVQGDFAGAIAACREAALREPDLARAWECLAELLSAKGEHAGAAAAYRQLIMLEYNDDILRAHGAALRANGDLPGAVRAYREAVRCDPERAINHHEYAMACLAVGDRRNYRRACSDILIWLDDTTEPETAALILRTCLPAANPKQDADLLLTLAEVAAKERDNLRLLGGALYRAGKFEEAIKALDDAAGVTPPCSWDLLFRAMAHHRLGQAGKARDAFDKAIALMKSPLPWPEREEVNELRREAESLVGK